jgi:27-O-demethylrifamycin SV methyltransferase
MSGQRVDLLYDALHAFEARGRGGHAYPVHKALAAERLGRDDIYDWILERIEPAGIRHVLDAGCGVGYGSIRLAQTLGCRVTGISVSGREVANASAVVRRLGLGECVEFRRASFDDLPLAAYDLIVAVESLKHSGDLARSASSMLGALTPSGLLVIVDDCYDGRERGAVEQQLMADWELTHLYTEHDFLAALGATRCSVVDLSDGVRCKGRWGIALRLLGVELSRPFVGASVDRALRAFRGGLRLEQLYADGAMAYKAIFAKARGA